MIDLHKKTRRISQCSFEGGIRDIADACHKLELKGMKTFHFEIGEPDFNSPDEAKEACKRAIDDNMTHYTSMYGMVELRNAIVEHEARRGHKLNPDNIVVTCGAEEALMTMMLALLDIGDEVVLFTPCYLAYREEALFAGAVPVEVPANLGSHYGIDMDKLKAAVTDKTRMILINTPNNPSGGIVSREDMDKLVEFVKGKNIWLVADECYSEIIYGAKHVSPLDYPEIADQTIVINSASKTFCMTGWRVGYAYVPHDVVPMLAKAHLMTTSCAGMFVQVGAAAAFKDAKTFTQQKVAKFKERRDVVVAALKRCPGADFPSPEGAFYVLPSIEKLHMKPLDFATELMNKYGVAVVPSDSFGIKNRVRIAYTVDIEKIREGMELFVKFYNERLQAVQK
jgi:aspartate/methionine/tyrosine aminotransferase